jgi:branched-subunit amino acid transport protein
MSDTAAFIALVAAALGTYAFRGGLILLLADRTLPATVERALQNVGPAVLTALTINLAVSGEGGGSIDIDAAEFVALIAAGVVAVWRKNLMYTLLAGMTALLVADALI